MNDFEILNDLFPGLKFIYLYRLNKIKQAISWKKARQSGQYIYEDAGQSNLEYSSQSIRNIISKLLAYEAGWMNFFEDNNITPHVLTYESLCDAKVKTIADILKFLEINIDVPLADALDQIEIPLQQYDDINREWYKRYLSET